jgi:hypothetical protein
MRKFSILQNVDSEIARNCNGGGQNGLCNMPSSKESKKYKSKEGLVHHLREFSKRGF